MSEKTNGKSPHLTFGVRVPNSGPLATVDRWSKWLKKPKRWGSIRFGFMIT